MKCMGDLINFGLINIDKPVGPTSFSVSDFVRKKLGLGKTSHMGTLDPKVSGVLPITLGRACRLAGYLIKHDKTYVGILETHRVCNIVELQKLIDGNFVGRIKQIPPHRSAVARREREREVFYWKLIEAWESSTSLEKLDSANWKSSSLRDGKAHASRGGLGGRGKYFLFECRVEGGTYVRKLCSDLGEMIGGAHMGELRRISAGIFSEADRFAVRPKNSKNFSVRPLRCETGFACENAFSRIFTLYDFERAVDAWKDGDDSLLRGMVVPAEDVIREVLPVVEVEKSALKSLYVGRALLFSNVVGDVEIGEGESFAVFCGGVFVGIYKKSSEKGVFGRAEFVCN